MASRPQTDLLHRVEVGAFPRLRLEDTQWQQIAALSEISPDKEGARRDIEIALGMYRQWQADGQAPMPAHEIRNKLLELSKRSRKLCDDLLALVRHAGAYEAASSIKDPSLSQVCELLIRLPKWFTLTWDRVGEQKRGPKSENIYWLVAYLDGVRREWTGKGISRSNKRDDTSREYIAYVSAIADPSIGPGTIEKAMRERIKTVVD